MVIRGLLVLMITLTVITVPVAAQSPETEPIEGTLFFLDNGRLFRYQNGGVEPICNIPLTNDNAYTLTGFQYSDPSNVAYAHDTGLVAMAARNQSAGPRDTPYSYNNPDEATALYLCDTNTNELVRISPDPLLGFMHISPVFSPDKTQIAWFVYSKGKDQVLLYDIASKQVSIIYEFQDRGYFSSMSQLIWDEAGLVLHGGDKYETKSEFLTVIDPVNGGVVAEQFLFPDGEEGPEFVYKGVFTWAMADDQAVVVYALGHPDTELIFYYDPATNERFIATGRLAVIPADWHEDSPPQVNVELFKYPGEWGWGLAAVTNGPRTFNGNLGEFAFSPDGRYLAMLVEEGRSYWNRGGDLYLLDSGYTHGALGYYVTAQRVGDSHDWGERGISRVFWGESQGIISEFRGEMPISEWDPTPG